MPKNFRDVLPLEGDEPVRYQTEPGKTGVSQDAVVKLLVRGYGVPPEHAVNLAPKLIGEDSPIVHEAMGMVAERETARLRQMKRYTDIKKAEAAGETLNDAEMAFISRIDTRRDEILRERAQSEYTKSQGDKQRHAEGRAALNARGQVTDEQRAGAEAAVRQADPTTMPFSSSTTVPSSMPFRNKVTYRPSPAPVAGNAPVQHPIERTAQLLMSQFGADPQTAAAFAQQLHGNVVHMTAKPEGQ